MRLPLLVIAAACAAIPAVAAAKGPLTAAPDAGFKRQTALPSWALPLGEIPATTRLDPVVLRLTETQAWVGAKPALLFNRAVQVNDSSALGTIGQVGIDYYAAYQKLLLHRVVIIRDGRMIDHTASVNTRPLQRETAMENGMMGGATTLQLLLDDVRIGDTLWITYTIEGENPVFGKLWSGDFSWDASAPTELRLLTVLHPVARPLQWRQLGDFRSDKVEPLITRVGDVERLRFEGRAIDEIEAEPSVPSDYLAGRMLQFSEYRNWQDVANWADGLFPKNKASPALTALVRQFAAEPEPAARAAAALRWVQHEIRYFSVSIGENSHRPQVPDVVLQRRYGDCKDKSYLLVSLLTELGIEAHPVLLSASAPKLPARVLASPLWFNHVVVQIKLDGHDYYVDPTMARQPEPLAQVPGSLPGAAALLVGHASTGLLTLPPRANNFPHYELVQNIAVADFSGGATMEARDIFRGIYADRARLRYPVMSVTEQKKAMLASYEKRYPGITLLEPPQLQDFPAENRFEIRSRYLMPKVVTLKDGAYGIDYDPKLINDSLGIPDKIVRNFPLELAGGRFRGRYRLNLTWPQSLRGAEEPHANSVDNVFFGAHEEYTFRGNVVNYLMDYRIKRPVVAAADMSALQAEVKRLDAFGGGRFKAPTALVVKPDLAGQSARELDSLRNSRFLSAELAQLAAKKDADIATDEACRFVTLAGALDGPGNGDLLKQAQRLEKVVAAKGEQTQARACLAQLAFARGQFSQSAALYRAVADKLTGDNFGVRNLAWASLYAGDTNGALASMARYRGARSATEAGFANSVDIVDQSALLQRAGKPLPAAVQTQAAELPDGPWPRPLLAMQAGLITPQALIQAAEALPGDARAFALTEAWFYIGQAHLAKHELAAAKTAFQWVASSGIRSADVHPQAMAELQRLAPSASQAALSPLEELQQDADGGDAKAQFALADRYYAGDGVLKDLPKALSLYTAAAAQGHARAHYLLGTMYGAGVGVRPDLKRAFEHYQAGAQAGDPDGMRALAFCYRDGDGVAKDGAQAVAWFQRAAAGKDLVAMDALGYAYETAQGVERDLAAALRWYRAGAEGGNASAQDHLAQLYWDGNGIEADQAQAVAWFRLAAAQGDIDGEASLGFALMQGTGVAKDTAQAAGFLHKASDHGAAWAMLNYAVLLMTGDGVTKDEAAAAGWYRKAAQLNDAMAQLYLGNLNEFGRGVDKDVAEAIKWYEKAAQNGNATAALRLGNMYTYALGVERNCLMGAKWFLHGSGLGDSASQLAMANMYAEGKGVARDGAKAFALIRALAEQDNADAKYQLGRYYENGIGVTRDDQLAAKWYQAAQAQGSEWARSSLYIMIDEGRTPGRETGDYKLPLETAAQKGDSAPFLKLATTYSAQFKRAQALAMLERALEVREAHPGNVDDLRLILERLADSLKQNEKYPRAQAMQERLLALTEQAHGTEHADVVGVLSGLSDILRRQHNYAQMSALLQRKLAIQQKLHGAQSLEVADALLDISYGYWAQEQFVQARQMEAKVLAMRATLVGAGVEDVVAMNIPVSQYFYDGKFEQAEPIAKRMLAIHEATYGPDNAAIVDDLRFLGGLNQELKRFAQAERYFKRALALTEQQLPLDPRLHANALQNLGQVYSDGMDQFDKAEPLLKLALAIGESEYGPDNVGIAGTLRELGTMYTGQKKYAQAEACYAKALALFEKELGPKDAVTGNVLKLYGVMLTHSGRYAEAEAMLQRSLAISKRVYIPGHPQIAATLRNMTALVRVSKGAKAAEEFEKRAALDNPTQG